MCLFFFEKLENKQKEFLQEYTKMTVNQPKIKRNTTSNTHTEHDIEQICVYITASSSSFLTGIYLPILLAPVEDE
jgi:hypothetical protein